MQTLKGTFEVQMHAEPPIEQIEDVVLGRASFDKQFSGELTGSSKVYMLSVRTGVKDSAAYVAVERITAQIAGKSGTFVVHHTATMHEGARSLTITIAPNSGTGELKGIAGSMTIEITDRKHFYQLQYSLPS